MQTSAQEVNEQKKNRIISIDHTQKINATFKINDGKKI